MRCYFIFYHSPLEFFSRIQHWPYYPNAIDIYKSIQALGFFRNPTTIFVFITLVCWFSDTTTVVVVVVYTASNGGELWDSEEMRLHHHKNLRGRA